MSRSSRGSFRLGDSNTPQETETNSSRREAASSAICNVKSIDTPCSHGLRVRARLRISARCTVRERKYKLVFLVCYFKTLSVTTL
jgi:hypothetical protein